MKKLVLGFFMACLLTACQSDKTTVADESKILAQVGDIAVTEKYVQAYFVVQGIKEPTKEQFDLAFDAIIKQQSLVYQAKKDGLELSVEQQLSIRQLEDQALSQLAIQQYLLKNPVDGVAINAEYEKIISELKGMEYKVHHLLFNDQLSAFTVLDELANGKSYAELEAGYLSQHQAVKNVGDIGWVNIKQVPESFHEPLQSMQVKQVYPEILLSPYGVHILYLENKREVVPPLLEDVKAGIKKSLEQKAVDRYQQLVQIKAKVVLLK